jgi:hypothetical protein
VTSLYGQDRVDIVDTLDRRHRCCVRDPCGNGVAIFTKDGATHGNSISSKSGWSASTCRFRCPCLTTASAAEKFLFGELCASSSLASTL